MVAGRLTRRSLLVVAGGAVAGGALAHPARVLAALGGPAPPALADRWLGVVAAGVRTIELAENADLLGLEWQAPADARLQLRFRGDDGRWSGWVSAGPTGHAPDRRPARNVLLGEPVWTGGTRAVQLRASRALHGARLHLVDVSAGAGASPLARSPLARLAATPLAPATPVLAAGAGQPPIIARAAWARGIAPPAVAPEYGAVRLAFVHHTENPNGYSAGEVPAMLLAIFAFHRYVHGWNDIGYNFVIDAFGRIFEARAGGIDEPVTGAQAGGYNLVSTGVAVLGSFVATPISPAARSALQRLLAWKLSLHGVPAQGRVTVRVNPAGAVYSRYPGNALVPLPRIAGHRDADSTDCPGDALYGELSGVRAAVHGLAPNPARATLALGAAAAPAPAVAGPGAPAGAVAPAPAPTPAPGVARTLSGTLRLFDGTPISGASVQIQQRGAAQRGELVRERTLAQVTTDAAGAWSLPVALTAPRHHGTLALRALYAGAAAGAGGPPGAGATISDPLALHAAALIPQPAPAPTPAAAPAPVS